MSYNPPNPFSNPGLSAFRPVQKSKYVPGTREELETIRKQQMLTLDEREQYEKQIEDLRRDYAAVRRDYDALYQRYTQTDYANRMLNYACTQIGDANKQFNDVLNKLKPAYESYHGFAADNIQAYFEWTKKRKDK